MKTENKSKKRLVGAAVPVAALRGSDSTGVGEFLDLPEFGAFCKKCGLGLIQILPVNDTGFESSPYSALSAFALNPLYIKFQALEGSAAFSSDVKALRDRFEGETRFPYQKVLKEKLSLLRKIYEANFDDIKEDAALNKWIKENAWVKDYAVFRRLKEAASQKSWREWEKNLRSVSKNELTSLWESPGAAGEHLFWAWVQFNLDTQMRAAKKALSALGILLEGDIPILINEDSADVWAHPDFFNNNFSAGAPPDMYSPTGQNWGFPIYNWEKMEADGFSWWKQRLSCAQRYFDAYRIDHVLGFFRIWATPRKNHSAMLGRFIPSVPIKAKELKEAGFDEGRLRWMSAPHIPTNEVWRTLQDAGLSGAPLDAEVEKVFQSALQRIGSEELWLFKSSIKGEVDIYALDINEAAKNYLVSAWNNRLFIEYEKGNFAPAWFYHKSRAWFSLSDSEKEVVKEIVEKNRESAEKKWESHGRSLLSMLKESSSMLPCAEDLGAVPPCVPAVLKKLGILGLRVVRWTRDWDKAGQPYIPFDEYPELSVCTPAVHDTSTVREWWDKEAEQDVFSAFLGCPSLSKIYNPGTAAVILKKTAQAASRFRVFQIQDLLHLSPNWYAEDESGERINVPGTCNDFNWTYRLPARISEIEKDAALLHAIKEIAS